MSLSIELAMEVLESQEVTESMREKAKMVIREGGGVGFTPDAFSYPEMFQGNYRFTSFAEWLAKNAPPQLPAESEGAPKEDQP